jgi:hypothetical protein
MEEGNQKLERQAELFHALGAFTKHDGRDEGGLAGVLEGVRDASSVHCQGPPGKLDGQMFSVAESGVSEKTTQVARILRNRPRGQTQDDMIGGNPQNIHRSGRQVCKLSTTEHRDFGLSRPYSLHAPGADTFPSPMTTIHAAEAPSKALSPLF